MGPPDLQRHPGPPRHMGPEGLHGLAHGPRGMQGPLGGMMGPPPRGMGPRDPQGGVMSPQGNMMAPQGPMQGGMMGPPPRTHSNMSNSYGMGNMQGPPGGMHGPAGPGPPGPHDNLQGPAYLQNQGQTSGPMLHGLGGQHGQQGPNLKGDPRGAPHSYHLGPADRPGLGGSGGPDQGYWEDGQPARRAPQDFDGGQDFHGRGEENWRPGPGFQGGAGPRGRGHRGGGNGGNWVHDERFGGGDFRGRREDRFRAGGPGRPAARGFPDDYGGPDEVFDGPEDMTRGWDGGARGRLPPRSGGPPRGGGHDLYRDDGSSPAGRERSSSLQGMDMASLPPRKRPWQDGPGTGDPRDLDSSGPDGGRPQRDDGGFAPPMRGGRGGWGPGGPGPRRGGPPPRGAPRGVRGR